VSVNVRAHDYNFEEEIDLLFFDESRDQERPPQNTRKKSREKKNRPFLQTKTRDR
jgi:hypothetical protein